ncbi:MAG: hypothetical protein DDT19_00025 [Syntrophomonadaceae bacterium]|nr:hypothetical protein [Bacillota bacterium]
MKKLTVKKDNATALSTIDYMLGIKGSAAADPSMMVKWTSWNTVSESVKGVKNEWVSCIDRARDYLIWNRGRGRPFKNTLLHISDDQHIPVNYLKFMNDYVYNWIYNEFMDYMGIVAYHFKLDRFHFHLGINPVPINITNGVSILRISSKDVWWQNQLTSVIAEGYSRASFEMGLTTEPMTARVLPIGIVQGGDKDYYGDYMKKHNAEIFERMRDGR